MNGLPDERLDAWLRGLDREPPTPGTELEGAILREFSARAARSPRRLWIPTAVVGVAAAAVILLWLRIPSPPTVHRGEPVASLAVERQAYELSYARLQLEAASMQIADLRERAAETPSTTADPQPEPASTTRWHERFEEVRVQPSERNGLVRLALLAQTDSEIVGRDYVSERLDELARTYSGTSVGRRARAWAEQLDR